MHITSNLSPKIIPLRKCKHIERLVDYARMHIIHFSENWNYVLWSDEKKLELLDYLYYWYVWKNSNAAQQL